MIALARNETAPKARPARRARQVPSPAKRITLAIRVRDAGVATRDGPPVSIGDLAVQQRAAAELQVDLAIATVTERFVNTSDGPTLKELKKDLDALTARKFLLIGLSLQALLDSAAVRNALAQVQKATEQLGGVVAEMRKATQIVERTAQALTIVDKILETLGGLAKP